MQKSLLREQALLEERRSTRVALAS